MLPVIAPIRPNIMMQHSAIALKIINNSSACGSESIPQTHSLEMCGKQIGGHCTEDSAAVAARHKHRHQHHAQVEVLRPHHGHRRSGAEQQPGGCEEQTINKMFRFADFGLTKKHLPNMYFSEDC